MKIIKNTSKFDSKKLKPLFTLIHNLVAIREGRLPHWNRLKVQIANKAEGYSGRAYVGEVYTTADEWDVYLSVSENITLEKLSYLFAHELYHSYGYGHKQYRSDPLEVSDYEIIDTSFDIDDMRSKDVNKGTQINVVAKNYKKLLARRENLENKRKRYESNIKRVDNSLKKVEKSIKQYEKKYDNERLTAERIPMAKRKKGKHPKQVCKELCEKHDWLEIYHDDWYEEELVIYVYDKAQTDDDDVAFDSEHAYETWKQAKEVALELIDEHYKNKAQEHEYICS